MRSGAMQEAPTIERLEVLEAALLQLAELQSKAAEGTYPES